MDRGSNRNRGHLIRPASGRRFTGAFSRARLKRERRRLKRTSSNSSKAAQRCGPKSTPTANAWPLSKPLAASITATRSNTTTLGNASVTDTYLAGTVHGTSFTGASLARRVASENRKRERLASGVRTQCRVVSRGAQRDQMLRPGDKQMAESTDRQLSRSHGL